MSEYRVWVFTTDMGGVLTVAEGRELAAELSAQHKGLGDGLDPIVNEAANAAKRRVA